MLLKRISFAANKFSHFVGKKTMPAEPGKVKTVLCGKIFYFCDSFSYHGCSHYEVSSLSDAYFRKR